MKFEGIAERILDELVELKYYSTKSEAIRAGILELGQKWSINPTEEANLVIKRMQKMESEVKSGKKKVFPLIDVAKEAGVKL